MTKKTIITVWLALTCSVILTGCWDQLELDRRAFVIGTAIDLAENDQIKLKTQIYKPSKGTVGTNAPAFVNITTQNDTVFEAVRDIPSMLGRRPQWSHMRIVLVSEAFAKKNNISSLFDFFYRDHEVRLMTRLLMTKGTAGDYFDVEPMIESTVSQRISETLEQSVEVSNKSFPTRLLDALIHLSSETKTMVIPYIEIQQEQSALAVRGVAFIQDGLWAGELSANDTEWLLMLMDHYGNGIIKVPCMEPSVNGSKKLESVEVLQMKTSMKPKASRESVIIRINVNISSAIGELQCSDVTDSESERRFVEHLEQHVRLSLARTFETLQSNQIDVFGVGDHIYGDNPKLWKEIKQDWGDYFSQADVTIKVNVKLNNTGMIIGKSERGSSS